MAQRERASRITPSVLDRLLDDFPNDAKEDPPTRFAADFERFKSAVRRDLESLLNTRRESTDSLDAFPEAKRSILTYGLPDFTMLSSQSEQDRAGIREIVENAITLFEPRLLNVNVTISSIAESRHNLSFRVDALLRIDPAPAPVTFDAVLQLATQQYQVKF